MGWQDANPLSIDLVLEKVFSFLTNPEIKKCREVCSLWALVGYRSLLPRCKRAIVFGHSSSTRSNDIEEFTKLIKSHSNLPFNSFGIQPSTFALKRSQPLEEFFSQSAHLIQTLSLSYTENSHHKTCLSSNNFLMKFNLPCLSRLRFEVISNSYYGPTNALSAQELFHSLFFSAKNLVRLELVVSADDVTGCSPYLQTICSSSECVHIRMKELVLNVPLTDLNVLQLTDLEYQLHILQIQLKESPMLQQSLLPLLWMQCLSLTKLKMNMWTNLSACSQNMHDEEFPPLIKLDELEVLDWKNIPDPLSLPFQFSYETNFPKLRKLTFQSHRWQNYFMKFFPKGQNIYTLQELKLPKSIGIDSSFLVRRLSDVFPRLIKLDIAVTSESVECLSEVFRLITHLEDLTVSFVNWVGPKCIDYILTGIPETVCRQIYSDRNISSLDLSSVYIGPNIASLRCLRRLQLRNMSMFSHKGRPQYTDITGYHGIRNLKGLCSLSLWPSQMTEQCLEDLRKRFKVTLHSF